NHAKLKLLQRHGEERPERGRRHDGQEQEGLVHRSLYGCHRAAGNTVNLVVPGENILSKRRIACCHSLCLLGSKRSELSRERVRSLNTLLLYALRNGKDEPEPEP